MDVKSFRKSRGWTQIALAHQIGLQSRGQVADIERGREKASAEVAIKLDRLSRGLCPVHETRPDLHDVRVIRPDAASGVPA
ncbi:helix-turn-helix transcriptional regulator [Brevundimonas nasdae]|uniref:helix-turn-helix transcriptional regulator n=1 Tax=Brevundimonas nasdae TaxID=172043 RepID=UPI003F69221E